ncbi:MAG: ferrous iron transport protein B [Alphaproteobacteria bacterium]|nr:ferrous iron transport protein B [Alphaproteobacteria bacterium]
MSSEEKTIHVALVGTPNSGKTSLFNALTGSRQKVANYPGVTVERKSGRFATPAGHTVALVDLPGTYSLRGRSPDERITRDAVLDALAGETPADLLVAVADSTQLIATLRLALELKQTGKPVILALNMHDIALHRGMEIDAAALQEALGVPVVPCVAVRKGGTDKLLEALDAFAANPVPAAPATWQEPDAAALRAINQEAERLQSLCLRVPGKLDTRTARIDRVLLHPVWGIMILLAVLFLVFQAVFTWAQPAMDLVSASFDWLGHFVTAHTPPGRVQSFLADGVIAGVGGVVVFLPQILVLFFFILLLEDSGYMPRAAFLMDKIMGGVGLHGRAFIPLLSSFACAIPGIMAARVIDGQRDRVKTILVAPLMTCSARIPVYTLIIGAFVPDRAVFGLKLQGLVMFGLYAAGILGALGVAWVIKLFTAPRERKPLFMMQLPDYKRPHPRSVLIGLWTRAMMFLKRAGTTIFMMSMLIWFLSSFPGAPAGATGPAIDYSLAAMLGKWIQPLLAPIGFNWQISVALIPGMAAREVMVSALSTVYAVSDKGESLSNITAALRHDWTLATALSVLAWYIFAPQCLSTLAVIKRELNSWRMMWVTFFYMLILAYIAAFATYHVAVALGGG